MGRFDDMFKHVREMQENLQDAQKKLQEVEVTGVAGVDMVFVTLNSNGVKKVTLADSLLKEEKIVIEELIAAAINDGMQRLQRATKDKYTSIATDLVKNPFKSK